MRGPREYLRATHGVSRAAIVPALLALPAPIALNWAFYGTAPCAGAPGGVAPFWVAALFLTVPVSVFLTELAYRSPCALRRDVRTATLSAGVFALEHVLWGLCLTQAQPLRHVVTLECYVVAVLLSTLYRRHLARVVDGVWLTAGGTLLRATGIALVATRQGSDGVAVRTIERFGSVSGLLERAAFGGAMACAVSVGGTTWAAFPAHLLEAWLTVCAR